MKFSRLLAGIAAQLLAIPMAGLASDQETADPSILEGRAIWVIEYENDIFSGEDRYYTNGFRFSRVGTLREPPDWLASVARRFPGIDDADVLPYQLSINHNLYTPSSIEHPDFPPDDRPYAAWLNLQFATGTLSARGADRVHVGLGLVGPWAGGEEIQKTIHSLVDSPEPVGWDSQLRNEATLQLGYDRFRRVLALGNRGGTSMDVTGMGGVALGNAHTHLAVGGMLRVGHNMQVDYGPPRIFPAISGASYFMPDAQRSWYFYAGVEGRRVFRDMFIEGNTFGGVDGVSREREVGEVFGGFVYSNGPFRVAYTHVWRSREFLVQEEATSYGALSFSVWW